VDREEFNDPIYEEQVHAAESELSAFVGAVTRLYGAEQARLSAEDWLDESELMDSPRRSTPRDWRAVTVAASAQLANRLSVAQKNSTSHSRSTDTKVSPTLSSNCSSVTPLM
jgi:hypothetical protein